MLTTLRPLFIAVYAGFLLAPAALAEDHADADHAAIEATIHALYEVISGPVGAPRDFERMRTLFVDGAAMGAVRAGENGEGVGSVFSLDGYIERSGEFLVSQGFTERETRSQIDVWGEIAVARSAYEGVNGVTGEVFLIGVNFITLFKIEGEWKVASILWRTETEDWPIDAAFD